MNENENNNQEVLMKKHYIRLKNFLEADLDGREIEEQKIILQQAQKAAEELLKTL